MKALAISTAIALRACIESTRCNWVRRGCAPLAFRKPLRQDADRLATGVENGIGEGAHQSDARRAVDERDSAIRELATQSLRCFPVIRPATVATASEDTHPIQGRDTRGLPTHP